MADPIADLQQIAEENMGVTKKSPIPNFAQAEEAVSLQAIANMDESIKRLTKVSSDKQYVFDQFIQETEQFPLNSFTKEYYWGAQEELYPEGPESYRDMMVNSTYDILKDKKTFVEKEKYLRDHMGRWPMWMVDQFSGEFETINNTLNSQIQTESENTYREDVFNRMSTFMEGKRLDTTVGSEIHINDLLKMEALSLSANLGVQNGRIGYMGEGNKFTPAYSIIERKQVNPNDENISVQEQATVYDLANPIISTLVEENLMANTREVSNDRAVLGKKQLDALTSGFVPRKNWMSTIVSMDTGTSSPTDLIAEGLSRAFNGEVARGRIQNDKHLTDLVKAITPEVRALIPEDKEVPVNPLVATSQKKIGLQLIGGRFAESEAEDEGLKTVGKIRLENAEVSDLLNTLYKEQLMGKSAANSIDSLVDVANMTTPEKFSKELKDDALVSILTNEPIPTLQKAAISKAIQEAVKKETALRVALTAAISKLESKNNFHKRIVNTNKYFIDASYPDMDVAEAKKILGEDFNSIMNLNGVELTKVSSHAIETAPFNSRGFIRR